MKNVYRFLAMQSLKTVFQLKGESQLPVSGSFMHFREAFSLMLFWKNVERKEVYQLKCSFRERLVNY